MDAIVNPALPISRTLSTRPAVIHSSAGRSGVTFFSSSVRQPPVSAEYMSSAPSSARPIAVIIGMTVGPDLGVDRRDRNGQRLPEDDDRQHQHAGGNDDLADGRPQSRSAAGSPEARRSCHASPSSLRMPSMRAVSASRNVL